MLIAGLLLAVQTENASAAPAQFDLLCPGTFKDKFGIGSPEERHYVIDLDAKRYCPSTKCIQASNIKEVTEDKITFDYEQDALGGNITNIQHYVSRVTGDLVNTERTRLFTFYFRATCKLAPFSGLPAPKF